MRTRHKAPNLVSMWMLDVFCCALGCVTLLWLLSTREAKMEAARNASAVSLLAKTEADLKARQAELIATKADFDETKRKLNADLEELNGRYLAMTEERDAKAKQLASIKQDVTTMQTQLATAVAKNTELDDLLAKKTRQAESLAKSVSTSEQSAAELMKLLRDKTRERDDVAVKAKKAEDQLNDLDAKLKSITKESENATAELASMKKTGNELASAQAMIIDLQGQKAKLADKYDKLQKDSESRFAGIALTGRKVAFLVDTSGSMKLLDDKTPAPEKWPTVIETLSKVMRSLPELEQYQIITFSRDAKSLLSPGWQTYRGEASVREVATALRGVNPDGDTNMYDALDLAFRLRASGLDTLYLFSDGLPTSGPGLTAEQERTVGPSERSDKLSKHILRTLRTTWNAPQGRTRVRINAIGFFFESPEVGAFLWALSRDNDGSFVGMSKP
jgi:predicted  nucleic acid-binding Zn-ribbon protein